MKTSRDESRKLVNKQAFLKVTIPGNKDLHLRLCSFQQGKNKMKTSMKK
jgi:hypothetical protein